jgi:hypothetical protein
MLKSLRRSRWKVTGAIIAAASILCFAWLIFAPSRRTLIEMEYRAQGFQMVNGCNGGAANMATFDVFTLQQELNDVSDAPGVNTNLIVQLRNALVISQEKARVLSDDCTRRGHRETYPWKTNWAIVKEALTASRKVHQ